MRTSRPAQRSCQGLAPRAAPAEDRDVMNVLSRNNVSVRGRPDGTPMLFVHGFGCDQTMWRLVAPSFEASHRVVSFDYVGCGGSDAAAYDAERYSTLDGYAQDILDVVEALDLRDVVLVGHSVSAMTGVLAAIGAPERIAKLVLVCPSPRYLDDEGYVGGFSAEDIDGLLATLEANWLGWAQSMAPVIAGNEDKPHVGAELTAAFCRTDPDVARRFARATFLSDSRADLPAVSVPSLVLQCSDDAIAPRCVGDYVHRSIAGSELVVMDATGHCPQLSHPDETSAAIARFA